MQINLTGFLNGKNARVFMQELWDLLCSASTNPSGIPDSFIEQKKDEIKKRNVSNNIFGGHSCNKSNRVSCLCPTPTPDPRLTRVAAAARRTSVSGSS